MKAELAAAVAEIERLRQIPIPPLDVPGRITALLAAKDALIDTLRTENHLLRLALVRLAGIGQATP